MHSRASVVCWDRISATDRATFMARAPVDGLPIGQSMATAAIVRLMNAARAPQREQRPESDLPPADTETYTLVGLRRSLASLAKPMSTKLLDDFVRFGHHFEECVVMALC